MKIERHFLSEMTDAEAWALRGFVVGIIHGGPQDADALAMMTEWVKQYGNDVTEPVKTFGLVAAFSLLAREEEGRVADMKIPEGDVDRMLTRLSRHFHEPVMPLGRFCSTMTTWAGAIQAGVAKAEKEGRDYQHGKDFAPHLDRILLCIHKSNLLGRMFYGRETLRTRECPAHKGHWDGQAMLMGNCPHKCDGTGWLREEEAK